MFLGLLGLLVIGLGLMYAKWNGAQTAKKERKVLALFTAKALPLEVDLSHCKPLTTPFDNQIGQELLDRQFQHGWVSHTAYDRKQQENLSFSHLVLEYHGHYLGRERIFRSSSVIIDKTKIPFLLDMQQKTTIYISRDNPDQYYFDIEFLVPHLFLRGPDLFKVTGVR